MSCEKLYKFHDFEKRELTVGEQFRGKFLFSQEMKSEHGTYRRHYFLERGSHPVYLNGSVELSFMMAQMNAGEYVVLEFCGKHQIGETRFYMKEFDAWRY